MLTIKTSERHHGGHSSVFIVNFELFRPYFNVFIFVFEKELAAR